MPTNRDFATTTRHLGAWVALALPPLLWAGNFVVGRALRTDVPPMTLAFVRHLIALVCLSPFAWPAIRRDARRYWHLRWQLVRTALTGLAGFNLLVYAGLHSTTASNALLLNSIIPVLIVLFGGLIYKQRFTGNQVVGMALSCTGVLVIILHGELSRLIALQFSAGDAIVFLGMVCFALYSLWLRALPDDLNPAGLLGAQLLIAVLFLFPCFMWEYCAGHRAVWTHSSLLGICYVALVASLLATFLYMAGVARVGPSRAGLFIHLIPVYGALLSSLLLGETIRIYHFVGFTVILAGLVFSNLESRRGARMNQGAYQAAKAEG
ncbi:DMT family transporter [Paraburkholderia sp. Ac-20340]|uniref:DMT family transporter n=1 Tax=Paraburkholderia sp. Ac-20340 TaxID=2703888 RepID=UPI0019808462|nr:DMT family transporter [Paraburkholderia sp. Ac-20340]MBN3858594.1 DMT family transporter [Paraburkholderia sp. Ac-20340]